MKLKISKSKNTTLFYIIKEYTRNDKNSTLNKSEILRMLKL